MLGKRMEETMTLSSPRTWASLGVQVRHSLQHSVPRDQECPQGLCSAVWRHLQKNRAKPGARELPPCHKMLLEEGALEMTAQRRHGICFPGHSPRHPPWAVSPVPESGSLQLSPPAAHGHCGQPHTTSLLPGLRLLVPHAAGRELLTCVASCFRQGSESSRSLFAALHCEGCTLL